MGFNLRSGNSSGLKFKEMGSSPNKMDPSMIVSALGSMGGGDEKKEEKKEIEPPKIQGAQV